MKQIMTNEKWLEITISIHPSIYINGWLFGLPGIYHIFPLNDHSVNILTIHGCYGILHRAIYNLFQPSHPKKVVNSKGIAQVQVVKMPSRVS